MCGGIAQCGADGWGWPGCCGVGVVVCVVIDVRDDTVSGDASVLDGDAVGHGVVGFDRTCDVHREGDLQHLYVADFRGGVVSEN
jgi:hypothetical protein